MANMDVETASFMRIFIKARRWQFAKTYARVAPHWYTVREWEPDGQEAFERFVMAIRNFGHDERFGGRVYRYLRVNGFKYWTMGAPVGRTIIINRAACQEVKP